MLRSRVGVAMLVLAFTLVLGATAHATDTTLSEDAITAINDNKIVITNILKAAFGLVIVFLVFKWIKRGSSKA